MERKAPADSADSLSLVTRHGPVPLGFASDDQHVFLVARERSAQWPVDVLRSGEATVRLPSGVASGRARLISDLDEKRVILELFRKKYGPERFSRWYERPARVISIDLSATSRPPDSSVSAYYSWLESEFDSIADDYDHHITGNRINRLLRDRSLAHLKPLFSTSHHLLEIGCGSGMETVPMLREGHEILAVDISERMLETVRAKARADGLSERLRTVRLAAREIDRLISEYGSDAFDGGYSTYGALNCEPDLSPIPPALAALLKAGGSFVAGVYNRWCLFEFTAYLLTLQGTRAFGRLRNPIPIGASRFCVDVYAWSPGQMRTLFEPSFRVRGVEGVPVILPPSDLSKYADRFSRHFGVWAEWDRSVGRRWPWNGLGDHFLMTFERR